MELTRTAPAREYHIDLALHALIEADSEPATASALFLLWTSVDTEQRFTEALVDTIEVTIQDAQAAAEYVKVGMIGEASLVLGAKEMPLP